MAVSNQRRSRHWLGTRDLDQAIVNAWQMHEDLSPDISTEALMELVRDDTGADPSRQIDALRWAGLMK